MNWFTLPPVPRWDGLHPLVVHFPIALLLIVPLFLVLAGALRTRGRAMGVAALVLMAIGTAFALIAVETGEAAADLTTPSDAANAILERHEHLAEVVAQAFIGLTFAYAVLLGLQWLVPRLRAPGLHFPLHTVYLLAFLAGTLVLANAAHQGGTLVHEYGLGAGGTSAGAASPVASNGSGGVDGITP